MAILRRQRKDMGRTGTFAFALALVTSACVPADIRTAMPGLSTVEPTYAGRWRPWFPRWYTLYSVLPGDAAIDCRTGPPLLNGTTSRRIALTPCMPLPAPRLSALAGDIAAAADATEAAFAHRIRISRVELRVVQPGARVLEGHSALLDRNGLALRFVAPYAAENPDRSERAIVRSAAHELFHMAKRALSPWHDPDHAIPPEEVAAALFESCVEDEVFGSVSASALDVARQPDPRALAGSTSAYRSAGGNLQATRQLSDIAGPDGIISTADEQSRLGALCASLAP